MVSGSHWFLRALLLALLASLCVPAGSPPALLNAASERAAGASGPLPLERPVRWAYYLPPDRSSLESLRANQARLDVVAPHWLTMDGQGRLAGSLTPEVRAYVAGLKGTILPSVPLVNHDAGDRVVTDDALSATAITQLTALAREWDGIALDFEGLAPTSREGLTRFIRRLGTSIRQEGKTFAIAIPGKTSDVRTGWSGAYDLPAIADAADLYLVMAYGFRTSASSEPGSTAPLPWVEAAVVYTTQVIPPERVVLGVAFYGYDWNLARGAPARALRYADTAALIERVGATPALDGRSASATFTYVDADEPHVVWFEDARSLQAKLQLVGRYGLRGAGAWRLGQEDPGVWPVWDAALGAPAADGVGRAPATGGAG